MIKMKIRMALKTMVFFLAFWMIAFPVFSQTQDENPKKMAEEQARKDVDSTFWFAAGVFLNLFVIIFSNIPASKAPTEALLGKSQEYIAIYTEAYKQKIKQLQGKYAFAGCATNSVILICFFIFVNVYLASE